MGVLNGCCLCCSKGVLGEPNPLVSRAHPKNTRQAAPQLMEVDNPKALANALRIANGGVRKPANVPWRPPIFRNGKRGRPPKGGRSE